MENAQWLGASGEKPAIPQMDVKREVSLTTLM
jgi:hypothetical protein